MRKIMVCGLNQLGLCEEKGFEHATEVPWENDGEICCVFCFLALSLCMNPPMNLCICPCMNSIMLFTFVLLSSFLSSFSSPSSFFFLFSSLSFLFPYAETPVRVVAGHGTSFVVTRFGNLYSWGQDRCGVLGHGDKNLALRVPRQVMALNRRKIKEIATGLHHALAIDDERKVWGWGKNNKGQCGLRYESEAVLAPTELPDFNIDQYPLQMCCGQEHNFCLVKALRKDGTTVFRAYSWGDWSRGQMGSGIVANRHTPQENKVTYQPRHPIPFSFS